MKNFYELLEINSNSAPEEIRKAYRKLSLHLHPDRNNNNPEKVKIFNQITSAYEVLSDLEKKKSYDKSLNLQNLGFNLFNETELA